MTAFLLTEPGFGSDPARMKSTAVPTEDGKGYWNKFFYFGGTLFTVNRLEDGALFQEPGPH